jgi:hypothetical protein
MKYSVPTQNVVLPASVDWATVGRYCQLTQVAVSLHCAGWSQNNQNTWKGPHSGASLKDMNFLELQIAFLVTFQPCNRLQTTRAFSVKQNLSELSMNDGQNIFCRVKNYMPSPCAPFLRYHHSTSTTVRPPFQLKTG